MEKQLIRQQLVEVLCDIQVQGGYGVPEVGNRTRPLEDLEGFDSQLAVEATSELSSKLGITIPPGENVFKEKGVARALELGEVVDALARIAASAPAHAETGDAPRSANNGASNSRTP